MGIIRQEIDNLMRLDFLLYNVPKVERDALCDEFLKGQRWKKQTSKGKLIPITDKEFHELSVKRHEWASRAYQFCSKFIHLSNLWDYGEQDPFTLLPQDEHEEMRDYLSFYHDFPGDRVTMGVLVDYLPAIYEKISGNVEEYYVSEDDGGWDMDFASKG
ncbi:hypothetical protein [Sedimentimonas flavescens]|uniref:hypothetical protein n=1 Tax=Sedimentimonas flavescens TaxID=2851012 RepID=UPI0021A86092|nr:hypothetical protein [Sedimentimonas flavescens]MCT2541082.1 hypothetical protein [Sedimentimonas flavescens]